MTQNVSFIGQNCIMEPVKITLISDKLECNITLLHEKGVRQAQRRAEADQTGHKRCRGNSVPGAVFPYIILKMDFIGPILDDRLKEKLLKL